MKKNMKKWKLIAPIVGIAGLASSVLPIVGCSCGNPGDNANIELSKDVTDKGVSVKESSITKGKESTFSLNLPTGKLIDDIEITIGNATYTKADGITINSNKVTIPADKMTEGKVTVKTITLKSSEEKEWSYDWESGKAYVNPVTRSTLEYFDATQQYAFNNAYLAEVAKNKEILAADILESFNFIWKDGNTHSPSNDVSATVKDIEVTEEQANGDYLLSFKLNGKANIHGFYVDRGEGTEGDIDINQTIDLTFTKVKLTAANNNFHFIVDLNNTSTDWSVTGEMTKQIGNEEKAELTVNLAAGKTSEIADFNKFAYSEKYQTLIMDALTAHNFEKVSTVDRELKEIESKASHVLSFSKLYDKTKIITGKIEPTDTEKTYWPKVELFVNYESEMSSDTQGIGSWTSNEAVKDDQEFKINVGDYSWVYTDPEIKKESISFTIKLTLQEYKRIEYSIDESLKDVVSVASDSAEYALKTDEGYKIIKLNFNNKTESDKLKLIRYGVQIKEDGSTIDEFEIEKVPYSQEITYLNKELSDIEADHITVKILSNPTYVDCIPIDTSSITLPENMYLSADGLDAKPFKPYLEVEYDEEGQPTGYYVMPDLYVNIIGDYSDVKHVLKYTLKQSDKEFVKYCAMGGQPSSTALSYKFKPADVGVDPTKPMSLSLEFQEPNWACYYSYDNVYPDGDNGWEWTNTIDEFAYIYKDDNGKLNLSATIGHNGSITEAKTLKVCIIGENGDIYGEQQITINAGETSADVNWSFDWPDTLQAEMFSLSAEYAQS